MAATAEQLQQLIILETGAGIDGDVAASISTWWTLYASRGADLQYLYTQRSVLNLLLGKLRLKRNVAIGPDKFNNQDQFENTWKMLQATKAEIDSIRAVGNKTLYTITPVPLFPGAYERAVKRANDLTPNLFAVTSIPDNVILG